MIMQWGK